MIGTAESPMASTSLVSLINLANQPLAVSILPHGQRHTLEGMRARALFEFAASFPVRVTKEGVEANKNALTAPQEKKRRTREKNGKSPEAA
jgi:hypothetical protein